MNCFLKTLNRTKKDVTSYEHKINIHTPVCNCVQTEGEGVYNIRTIKDWISTQQRDVNLITGIHELGKVHTCTDTEAL
jgi:hypothetical protein